MACGMESVKCFINTHWVSVETKTTEGSVIKIKKKQLNVKYERI